MFLKFTILHLLVKWEAWTYTLKLHAMEYEESLELEVAMAAYHQQTPASRRL